MKEIKLTRNLIAMVDDEDFNLINQYKWYALRSKNGSYYAARDVSKIINGKRNRQCFLMHRELLNVTDSNMQVDHIDGNKLNNTKSNLRLASNQNNNRNQLKLKKNNGTGYRGVYFYKDGRANPWVAYVRAPNTKRISLGSFNSAEDAARAFDEAAKILYGEFCGKLNFT